MDPTKKRIRHVKRLAEAAVPLKNHWETPGPGRGKKLPPKQRVQSGNRSQYLVGPAHMKVDTFGKRYLPTLHIAFKAHRISAEVPRSSKESCCPTMAIRLV